MRQFSIASILTCVFFCSLTSVSSIIPFHLFNLTDSNVTFPKPNIQVPTPLHDITCKSASPSHQAEVSFARCFPQIGALIQQRDAQTLRWFVTMRGTDIPISDGACRMALRQALPVGQLHASIVDLTTSISRILVTCDAQGEGGVEKLHPGPAYLGWSVVVERGSRAAREQ